MCKLLREFQFTVLFAFYLSCNKEVSAIVVYTNLIAQLIQNMH